MWKDSPIQLKLNNKENILPSSCQQQKISIKINTDNSVIKKNLKLIQCQDGMYYGQVDYNDQFDGVGSFFFSSGQFYYGEWLDGQISGVGLYVLETGSYIKGQFKRGLVDGVAEIRYADGDTYQGYWKEGMYHGFGKKIKVTGEVTPVWYRDGQKDTQPNRNTSLQLDFMKQGFFDKLLRHHLPNITQLQDKIQYGTQLSCIIHCNGNIECGMFSDDCLNGRGRIIFNTGDIYDGQLSDGRFNGQGHYFNNENKTTTYGQFCNNQVIKIHNIIKQLQLNQDTEYYPPVDQKIYAKVLYTKTRRSKINPTPKNQRQQHFKFEKIDKIQNLISQVLHSPSLNKKQQSQNK